jgi:predicted PurR-regulated permease PerM
MSTVTAIFGVLLVIFLIIYIAVDPSLYASGVLRVVPERHRERTVEVGTEVVKTLKQWLAAQAISMAIIGAITTLALFLLDVRAAIALGILAGIAEFVPVFGPLVAAIPAVGIAFVDSPTKALYVIIAYVVIQQIESNVVAPLVMKRGVDVPPLVTILAGTIMTILFGFLGLLIAVPLAAALLTVARELTVPVDEDQLQEA